MRWGLVPFWWSKPLKELRLATFNARVETVTTKRALFELKQDSRPKPDRSASERYSERLRLGVAPRARQWPPSTRNRCGVPLWNNRNERTTWPFYVGG
jgi:hypothetical protein